MELGPWERNVWQLPAAIEAVGSFAAAPPSGCAGRVLGFAGAAAGSGSTALSSNFASLLGRLLAPERRVCFVSFDTSLWGIYPLLGPPASLPPALGLPSRALTAVQVAAAVEHRLDLGFSSLLLRPGLDTFRQALCLSALRDMFDVVVVDFPHVLSDDCHLDAGVDLLALVVPSHLSVLDRLKNVLEDRLPPGPLWDRIVFVESHATQISWRSKHSSSVPVLRSVPYDPEWAAATTPEWRSSRPHALPLRYSEPTLQSALSLLALELGDRLAVPVDFSKLEDRTRRRDPFRFLRRSGSSAPAAPSSPEGATLDLMGALVLNLRWDWHGEEIAHCTEGLEAAWSTEVREVAASLVTDGGRLTLSGLVRVISTASALLEHPAS